MNTAMCHPANETELPVELRTVHAACSLTIAIVGTFGNAMSLILIYKGRLYRAAPVTMLIIDLCVANVFSCGFILPFVGATSLYRQWVYGNAFCKAFGYITYVALSSECLIITNLALCHYLVVVHRVQIKDIIFNHRIYFRLFMLLGLPWVVAASVLLVPLTETWDTFGYDYRLGFCTLINRQNGIGMHAVGSIILISIMSAIILYCYPAILYTYIKSYNKARRSTQTARRVRTSQSKQLQLMISTIIINYLVTYFPYLITCIVDPCLTKTPLAEYTALIYICWSHAAINPFIYALLNTRIYVLWKKTFLNLQSVIVSKYSSSNLVLRLRRRQVDNIQISEGNITPNTAI